MSKKDLGGLPVDRYDVYVRRKIDQGLRDLKAGRTLTEAEFDQRIAKWLEPCNSLGPKGRPS